MYLAAGLYPIGMTSTGTANRIVPRVNPHMPTPFTPMSYKQQSAGAWLHPSPPSNPSHLNPFEPMIKAAASKIADFLKSAQNVQGLTNSLLQKSTSSLQEREASSSDKTTIKAVANNGATVTSYKVKVQSLAQAQKNIGTDLASGSPSSIQSGTHQIKLTIGGKSTKVTSHISAFDTNEQALTKWKNAINDAHVGVTASIVTDKAKGTSRLELKGDKTGTEQSFTISDETGNAATAMGIKTASESALNALYTVNGGATQTSQSNTIILDKGKVQATLLKISPEEVEISVKPDVDKVVSQVRKLIAGYDELHNELNEAGGYVNPAIKKSLENAVSSSAYEQIGIHKNGDGTLSLDEEKLIQSLSSNFEQTSKALTGTNGLAKSLEKATGRFNDIPASSLLNRGMLAMQQFATYQSTMLTSLQMPTKGMLMDGIF